jgi:hypothetical protein
MTSEFGQKLKELRERKFPGQSLRRVGEFLASRDFGKFFFTQLNKMESGTLFPSPNLFLSILDAYSADDQERREILTAYSFTMAHKKMKEFDQISKKPIMSDAVNQLYRKVKKKK